MTILYDEKIIQEFAQSLYAAATRITVGLTIIGAILGATLSAYVSPQLTPAGLFFGAIFGAAYGKSKSFDYKLRAQQALCNAETERHSKQTANIITEMLMIQKSKE